MKRLRKPALVLLALILLLQFVPAGRTNPPVQEEIAAPPAVEGLLERSCYDCHSNTTRWPWYSYVAPVSWLLVRDTNEARRELNFTEWNRYDARERAERLEELAEEVERGAMPLPLYLFAHPEARLSEPERRLLIDWAKGAADAGEEGGRGRGRGRGGR